MALSDESLRRRNNENTNWWREKLKPPTPSGYFHTVLFFQTHSPSSSPRGQHTSAASHSLFFSFLYCTTFSSLRPPGRFFFYCCYSSHTVVFCPKTPACKWPGQQGWFSLGGGEKNGKEINKKLSANSPTKWVSVRLSVWCQAEPGRLLCVLVTTLGGRVISSK